MPQKGGERSFEACAKDGGEAHIAVLRRRLGEQIKKDPLLPFLVGHGTGAVRQLLSFGRTRP